MKIKNILVLLGVLISCSLYSQNGKLYSYCPYPEIDETACGFVDSNNNIVIPVGKYQYIYTSEFDKIAFVSIKGKSGVFAIDRSENILFQVFIIDNGPDQVSNGLFRIVENGKIGFANMQGQIIIQPIYLFAFPFQKNGFAIFNEGATLVKEGEYHRYVGGKWGAINLKGEVVVPATFEEGKYRELRKGDKWYQIENLIK